MNGWIKLHRQFLEWEWYSDQNTKAVFIHCLLMANVEDNKWRGEEIKRGSFISSIGKVAIDTGLSIKAIRIALDKLKKTSEIITEGASQWTKITVCKYEEYQSYDVSEGQTNGKQKGKRGANEGQTKGELRATTKEYKNIRIQEGEEINNADGSALYKNFISTYNDFIKSVTDAPAKINGLQGKSAKEIISYLKTACLNKNPNSGEDEIINSWKWILGNYQKWGKFYQGQLELNQISKNLVNIINEIKNGKTIGSRNVEADRAELIRLAEERYSEFTPS